MVGDSREAAASLAVRAVEAMRERDHFSAWLGAELVALAPGAATVQAVVREEMLNGFGVSANYSYTTSQVSFPANFSGGRTDNPAMLRQAPNTWNLGFTYDKSRFSMRFGVSHNDANIYAYNYQATGKDSDPIVGLRGPTGDIYLYAHTQFDVQGSYRMYKRLQLVVSGLNLSNEVFGFYQGSPIYPIQREYYHPSYIFGLKWNSSGDRDHDKK